MDHNYQAIDEEIRYQQRQERLEIAQSLGFDTISESIVETYRATGSSTKTGKLLGGLTAWAILKFIRKIGEPRNGRGGDHR